MISYLIQFFGALQPALKLAIPWTILTWVIFPSIWRFFPTVDRWYRAQDYEKRVDWNARATATLHAAAIFLLSFGAIVAEPEFTWRDVFSSSRLAEWSLSFSTGYFISDCIVLHQLRKYYGGDTIAYAGHHFVSIWGLTQTLKGQAAVWFTCLRLCTELSTPFVNLTFMMMLFKMENTRISNINRHCGFWAFMVCRPCLMPIFWYCTLVHVFSGDFWAVEGMTQVIWVVAGVGLDALNLIWMKKIIKEYYDWCKTGLKQHLKPNMSANAQYRQTG